MLKGGLMKMKKEASVEAVRESAGAISSHFPVHCPLSETITLPPVLELRLGGASRGIIIRGQSAMMVISRFIQNIPNFFGKDDGQKPHICCILGRIGKVYDKNILYSPWLDCIHHHLCCLIPYHYYHHYCYSVQVSLQHPCDSHNSKKSQSS